MRLEQSNIPCERCHYLVAPEMTVCPECGTTIDYQGLSIKWAEARLGYSSNKRLGQNLAYGFMAIAIILLWLSGFVSAQRMSPVAFCLFLIVVQGPAMLGFIRISIFPAR